jgi:hypothetical protein
MDNPSFRTLCTELVSIIDDHCNPDEYSLPNVVDTLDRITQS